MPAKRVSSPCLKKKKTGVEDRNESQYNSERVSSPILKKNRIVAERYESQYSSEQILVLLVLALHLGALLGRKLVCQ